jgi:hypothetical protein
MKTVRKLFVALLLALTLGVSTYAGDMGFPPVPPPPPSAASGPPEDINVPPSTVASNTGEMDATIEAAALDLLFGVLAAF